MARLLLVRHGETEWIETSRYQGQSDIELSPSGLRQVERLRERLASEKIDALYSSDLRRAWQTAWIIAQGHKVEIVPCPELREVNFGEFEGKTFEQISQRYLPVEQMWRGENLHARAPRGESLIELATRVAQFIPKIRKHSQEETILLVGHSGSLQVLLCLLLGMKLKHWWRLPFRSASLTIVETYPKGAKLLLLNDVCHLENLRKDG